MSESDDLTKVVFEMLIQENSENQKQISELKISQKDLTVKVAQIDEVKKAIQKLEETKMDVPFFYVEVKNKATVLVVSAVSVGIGGFVTNFGHKIWAYISKWFGS